MPFLLLTAAVVGDTVGAGGVGDRVGVGGGGSVTSTQLPREDT